MQHRSISQRLTRAKSQEAKQATLNKWLDEWDASNDRFAQAALAGVDTSAEWCEDVKKRLAAIPNIVLKLQNKAND
jgi:hypothetical protein